MIRLKTLFFLLGMYATSTLYAQTSLPAQLAAAVKTFTTDGQMRYATTSLTVLNAKTGKQIYAFNENKGLATASTMKTITAATAFYLLGEDFTYQTRLFYSGTIRQDTLFGNIIIRGSGDPTLGSWRYDDTKMDIILQKWVAAIQKAGIGVIQGRVIGDASVFDSQMLPNGWIWQDVGNYYGAGASGLCWHENQYDLHLLPGSKEGDKVKITGTRPLIGQLHFINELRTGAPASGDRTYIYTAPYSHLAYVRGTAPAGHPHFQVSGSVPDPALFCANSLQQALQENNIRVQQPVSTYRLLKISEESIPENLHLLDTYSSPKLPEIIHWFLKKSINLYGEQLIKTIALQRGKTVNTENGVETEVDFWEKKDIDPDALHIIDGSGLSPGNHVTTKALATVLWHASRQSWYQDYYECMPVIHNIRMKSGHINKVAAYAGYINSANGTPLIFSFIVNNYSGPLRTLTPKIFRLLDQLKRR